MTQARSGRERQATTLEASDGSRPGHPNPVETGPWPSLGSLASETPRNRSNHAHVGNNFLQPIDEHCQARNTQCRGMILSRGSSRANHGPQSLPCLQTIDAGRALRRTPGGKLLEFLCARGMAPVPLLLGAETLETTPARLCHRYGRKAREHGANGEFRSTDREGT